MAGDNQARREAAKQKAEITVRKFAGELGLSVLESVPALLVIGIAGLGVLAIAWASYGCWYAFGFDPVALLPAVVLPLAPGAALAARNGLGGLAAGIPAALAVGAIAWVGGSVAASLLTGIVLVAIVVRVAFGSSVERGGGPEG